VIRKEFSNETTVFIIGEAKAEIRHANSKKLKSLRTPIFNEIEDIISHL